MKNKKFPIFDLKNINNSEEETPFISISNSVSNSVNNSSKNQNSKSSSNNYKTSLTQNDKNNNSSSNSKNNNNEHHHHKKLSLINIIREKLSKNNNINDNNNENSSEFLYIENSLINNNFFDKSFNNISNKLSSNHSLSEDKKESKIIIENKTENKTPIKKQNYKKQFFEKTKYRKKAVLINNNYIGKNLMDEFKDITVSVKTEEKDKNRVSSADNISDNILTKKKNLINTNKSWIKINIENLPKNPIKIRNNYNNIFSKNKIKNEKNNNQINFVGKNSKRSTSSLKVSSLKNFKNCFKLNNIDLENYLNKYMPKKISKKKNNNIGFMNFQKVGINKNIINDLNKMNTNKKINLKKTPKSDSYKRKLSFSYLKIRESALKNLFHDYKPKKNEDLNINTLPLKNKLSPKVIKETKQSISSNIFDKIINNKKIFIKNNPIKKGPNESKNNSKKLNNYNDVNIHFFKYTDKKDLSKKKKAFK